jgi:cobalt-zinc-cadmium efflux system outer membrane protein
MKIQWFNPLLAVFLGTVGVWLSGCATPPAPKWKPLDVSTLAQPLTLEQCLELAMQNDIQVVQWKARFDIAHAELISAKTLPNPSFSPSWDDVGLHDDAGKNIASLTYGVSYPIFFWLPKAQKIAVAKANRQAEIEKIRSEQRQLAIEVATAYFGLVADQRKEKIVEHLLQIADESMRLAQKKKELGMVSDYEVQRVRAEQLQAESDLLETRSQLRLDRLVFAFALGADRPFFPTVEDCGDTYTQFMKDSILKETLPDSIIENALQADPGWADKKARTIGAENQLQMEYRLAMPLTGTNGSLGPKDAPEGWGSVFSLEIPIPLFDRNGGAILKAEAELRTARAEEEKARRTAVAVVSQAWERYHASAIQWNRYTQSITELAQKNEQSAFKLFAAGQIEYGELLIAQRDNRQAKLTALTIWRDTSAAAWVLSCALGQHDSPSNMCR